MVKSIEKKVLVYFRDNVFESKAIISRELKISYKTIHLLLSKLGINGFISNNKITLLGLKYLEYLTFIEKAEKLSREFNFPQYIVGRKL